MRDVRVKEDSAAFIVDVVDNVDIILYISSLLPSDRVVSIDSNNNVYLYDKCFKIDENDIEEEL